MLETFVSPSTDSILSPMIAWLLVSVLSIALLRLYRGYVLPARLVQSMIEPIARGERPSSFVQQGPPLFRSMIASLEVISRESRHIVSAHTKETLSLQTVAASLQEGIVLFGPDHKLLMINPPAVELLGIKQPALHSSPVEALGQHLLQEAIYSASRSLERRSFDLTLYPDLSDLDHPRILEVSACPVLAPDATCSGTLLVLRDTTEARQLEEKRKDFVANTSHELRTPLSIFQGYVETLMDYPEMDEDKRRHILDRLHLQTMRLNALVDDLMTLTRIESKLSRMEMEDWVLGDAVKELLNDYAARRKGAAAGREIRFIQASAASQLRVRGDRTRVQQVLLNLIDNAAAYSPSGSPILIHESLSDSPGLILVRVQDYGQGIPAADLPRVFERFYRVDKGRGREQGGTGLGLSIVRHIVAAHGGTVWIESQVHQGTTVFLTLPMPQENEVADS